MVEHGQRVRSGQLIARGERPGAVHVHAPWWGRIEGIRRVDTAQAPDVPAIEISLEDAPVEDAGGRPRRIASPASRFSATDLAEIAEQAGVTTCCRPSLPLAPLLRQAESAGVTDVIINALPPEPLCTVAQRMLLDQPEVVATGAVLLRDAVGARRAWLVVDRSEADLAEHCRSVMRDASLSVIALPNKYPQAAPVLLTKAILDRETPIGHSPLSVGAFVAEATMLAALVSAVLDGAPMVDRVVSVAGPAARRPGHYRIMIGTAFADVVAHVGIQGDLRQIIDGGPLNGRALESLDAVVTKQTSAIWMLDAAAVRAPNPGPCVRCGWCQEDCPVGLDPQAILAAAYQADQELDERLHPEACLECGLCSYVCPAELPLAEATASMRRRIVPRSESW